MATHLTRPTNGVSYGYVHTVTSTDVSNGSVIIDFQVDYMLAAVVMITRSSAIPELVNGDVEIDYPANGQVRISNGSSQFTLVAAQQIHIIANRRSS